MGQFCSKRRSDDGPSVDPPDVEGGTGASEPELPPLAPNDSGSKDTFSKEELEEMKRIAHSVGGVPVVFGDENAEDREVIFQRLPLGMKYKHKEGAPVAKVTAGSHAADLGVCVGWTLRKICGQTLNCKDFDSIGVALKELLEELQLEGMPADQLDVESTASIATNSLAPTSEKQDEAEEVPPAEAPPVPVGDVREV